MADSYENELDQQIRNLKRELHRQTSIHHAYASEGHQQSAERKMKPHRHTNRTRDVLAKKYHIRYEDTIDTSRNGINQLNAMIGLRPVKNLIKHYVADAEVTRQARKLGQNSRVTSLNMVFMGNPGTGKTVVARLVGKILFQKHLIKKPLFKECSARDLLSTLVGGALLKTHRLMQHSRGGVLFIDEAYVLAPSGNQNDAEDSTKQDAVSELLRLAENYRHDTVVILAGYRDRMEELLNHTNEGLRSRFNHKVLFPDYSDSEMFKILMYHAKKNYCRIGKSERRLIKRKLPKFIKAAKLHHEDSNARLMRNLLQAIMSSHRYHLAITHRVNQLTLKDINTLSSADVLEGLRQTSNNE